MLVYGYFIKTQSFFPTHTVLYSCTFKNMTKLNLIPNWWPCFLLLPWLTGDGLPYVFLMIILTLLLTTYQVSAQCQAKVHEVIKVLTYVMVRILQYTFSSLKLCATQIISSWIFPQCRLQSKRFFCHTAHPSLDIMRYFSAHVYFQYLEQLLYFLPISYILCFWRREKEIIGSLEPLLDVTIVCVSSLSIGDVYFRPETKSALLSWGNSSFLNVLFYTI